MFDSNTNISNELENKIISKIDTKPPQCFKKFNQYYLEKEFKIDLNIIKNIKNIVIKNKIFTNALNFNKKNELMNDYNSGVDIIELSKKYDLPPLFLLNMIFKKKYDKNIIFIIKNLKLLDDKDWKLFSKAKLNDVFTIEDNKINNKMLIYKEYIKYYLYKNNIKFIENEYWFELENYVYKNKNIKWILYTDDYGSCLKKEYEITLNEQLKEINIKYKNSNGLILFSNNYCDKLKIKNADLIYLKINDDFTENNNIIYKETSKNGDFYKMSIESMTDKVSQHYYYSYYPLFLNQYRNIIKNNKKYKYAMLEIGVDKYRSINLWKKYFPESFIYGIDIDIQDEGKNYKIIKCDQSNTNELENVSDIILKDNRNIFFIIDDGSHYPEHQIKTFNLFFDKLLCYGGTYIIEDIETSYWTKNDIYGYKTRYGYNKSDSLIEVFKNLIDIVNSEFLTDENKNIINKKLKNFINNNVINLISGIFFGQNNLIITKKTLNDLAINKRKYRFEENL